VANLARYYELTQDEHVNLQFYTLVVLAVQLAFDLDRDYDDLP
jgi:hypothetical protein